MGGQFRFVASSAGLAGAQPGFVRRVAVGVVLAMVVAVMSMPAAWAQDDAEATVANDTNSSASSDSEIKAGDIVTGLNSGNVIATGDNYQSQVQIHGGNYTSPTYIDFYIDGGWSDAYSDAGYNESVVDGPEVGDGSAVGDDNYVDNSEDYSDNSTDVCC